MKTIYPIEWLAPKSGSRLTPGLVRFIDQTQLPGKLVYKETDNVEDIAVAIKTLAVRGAPAIGIVAAFGVVLAAQRGDNPAFVMQTACQAADYLAATRPTAKNLFWALERMKRCAQRGWSSKTDELKEALASEAMSIRNEEADCCHKIGQHGVNLIKAGNTILTHCNAGYLATIERGTALAPIYEAHERGLAPKVFADETRPLCQGSRLTAWELSRAGVPVTVCCDNMAASLMRAGRIDLVMVGSDRIAANGDVANKIGTYGVAVLAHAHKVPFYVLAPTSTFDLSLADGAAIPIEQRDALEVSHGFGKWTAPRDVPVYNPAFDVTPNELITAIVCEKGIIYPPYGENIGKIVGGA